MSLFIDKDTVQFCMLQEAKDLLTVNEWNAFEATGNIPDFKAVLLQEGLLSKFAGGLLFGIPAMLAKKANDVAIKKVKDMDKQVTLMVKQVVADKTISDEKKVKFKKALEEYKMVRRNTKKLTPNSIILVVKEFVKFVLVFWFAAAIVVLPVSLYYIGVLIEAMLAAPAAILASGGIASAGGSIIGAAASTASYATATAASMAASGTISAATAATITTGASTAISSVATGVAASIPVVTTAMTSIAALFTSGAGVAGAAMNTMGTTVGMSMFAAGSVTPVGIAIIATGVLVLVGYLLKKLYDYKTGKMTSVELEGSLKDMEKKAKNIVKTASEKDKALVKKHVKKAA